MSKFIYIFILFVIFSIMFVYYLFNYTKYKHYAFKNNYKTYSNSLQQSKEFRVFICEYVPEKREYIFCDDTLKIAEVWLERCWKSTKFRNEIDTTFNPKNCFTIYIRTKNRINSYSKFESGYTIYNPYLKGIITVGPHTENLISISYECENFEESLDTLIYPVYTYSHKNGDMNAEKLGEIKLFKKK